MKLCYFSTAELEVLLNRYILKAIGFQGMYHVYSTLHFLLRPLEEKMS